jgi:hypothetical protein
VKSVTIQILLTLSLTHKWLVQQIDITNDFLNDFLQEVHKGKPQGFTNADRNLVCRFKASTKGVV